MPARIHSPHAPERAARFAASLLAVVWITAAAAWPAGADRGEADPGDAAWLMHGTWEAGADRSGEFWMNFRARSDDGASRQNGSKIAPDELDGLDPRAVRGGESRDVEFRVHRDAGTIVAKGRFDGGRGAGTYALELDPSFPAALERRGVGRPSRGQQAELLLAGAGFELLDALAKEKYPTPDVRMMVRMAHHGVNARYVSGMAKAGYRLGSNEDLVHLRDHGVDPNFIEGMAAAGYRSLNVELLLRARDHGADPDFAEDMAGAGYGHLPLETLIRARDHGVDSRYVAHLRKAGFGGLRLDEAIRARDHGVTPAYASRARDRYPDADLDDVIRLRDHGEQP